MDELEKLEQFVEPSKTQLEQQNNSEAEITRSQELKGEGGSEWITEGDCA